MLALSIIIPVYNSETHLERCIQSILTQKFSNFELILVNDGSTDQSATMCDKYASLDSRISVIHQKNEGVSSARNIGLQHARGKYIQFVDSDDFIDSEMSEVLMNKIIQNKTDIVITGFKVQNYSNGEIASTKLISYREEDRTIINELGNYFGFLYENGALNSPCNKIYKKDLIHERNLAFIKDLEMGEDLVFNINYFRGCHTVTLDSGAMYNYTKNINPHSLTRKKRIDAIEISTLLYKEMNLYCKEIKVWDQVKINIKNVYLRDILYQLESILAWKQVGKININYIKGSSPNSKIQKIGRFVLLTRSRIIMWTFCRLKVRAKKMRGF